MSDNKYPIGGYAPVEIKYGQLWARHSELVTREDLGKYRIDFEGLKKAVDEALLLKAKPAGAVWPLFVIDKITGERHEVNKIVYHPENEPEPHVWCDTWCGHHVIGKDCEWVKKQPAGNDHITAALRKFISMHETGLLPNKFTYEEGKKALEGLGIGNDAVEFAKWLDSERNSKSANWQDMHIWGGLVAFEQMRRLWQQSKSK